MKPLESLDEDENLSLADISRTLEVLFYLIYLCPSFCLCIFCICVCMFFFRIYFCEFTDWLHLGWVPLRGRLVPSGHYSSQVLILRIA